MIRVVIRIMGTTLNTKSRRSFCAWVCCVCACCMRLRCCARTQTRNTKNLRRWVLRHQKLDRAFAHVGRITLPRVHSGRDDDDLLGTGVGCVKCACGCVRLRFCARTQHTQPVVHVGVGDSEQGHFIPSHGLAQGLLLADQSASATLLNVPQVHQEVRVGVRVAIGQITHVMVARKCHAKAQRIQIAGLVVAQVKTAPHPPSAVVASLVLRVQ